jgi:hypothetical protein
MAYITFLNPLAKRCCCCLFILLSLLACQQDDVLAVMEEEQKVLVSPPFARGNIQGIVEDDRLTEVSGIAASQQHPGSLWVHNDSGNEPLVYLLNQKGETQASYAFRGVEQQDWEDMALGPGPEPGKAYLYLADIGDNARQRAVYSIVRCPEPAMNPPANAAQALDEVTVIRFRYPEVSHDAEALMVDPATRDIYIITKSSDKSELFRIPYRTSYEDVLVAEKVGQVGHESKTMLDAITASDISTDGQEVLIKSYNHIYYWKRSDQDQPLEELLQTSPLKLAYEPEPQGEAIAFAADGSGYFSLSEQRFGIRPRLIFYARKQDE